MRRTMSQCSCPGTTTCMRHGPEHAARTAAEGGSGAATVWPRQARLCSVCASLCNLQAALASTMALNAPMRHSEAFSLVPFLLPELWALR